jgi:hypothetical protein
MVVLSTETRRLEVTQKVQLSRTRIQLSTSKWAVAANSVFRVKSMLSDPWRHIGAVCIAFQLMAGGALANDNLRVNLIPLGLRARSAAPISVEARFSWDATRILEGRLEMVFHEGNRVLGRYRSAEMALTTGEQKFRMLLPPPLTSFSDSQMEVKMKFVSSREVFDLEPSSLFVPTAGERSLVVGWCGGHVPADQRSSGLERSLLFERFAPESVDASRWSLVTSLARFPPADLPVQPLAYTSFDVVVLTAEAFKEARERQLQALARWVNGGGSVCVFVAGGLQPHHLSFLNELAETHTGGPAFLSDQHGNLLEGQSNISRLYSALGRTVVITGDIATDPGWDSSAWRETVAFLWKVRRSQVRAILDTGHWNMPSNSPPDYRLFSASTRFPQGSVRIQRRAEGSRFGQAAQYAVQPSDLGADLVSRLMPKTVRLIPSSALIALLSLFVLMIGPVDYFLLGFFRRHRYTWILFPATSIAFTVATVLMANYYLGERDLRRSLVVLDIAADGTALRWNRFELVFAACDKQSVTELKDALWAPVNFRSLPLVRYPAGYRSRREDAGQEDHPPLYEGSLPAHFRSSISIRQWRPELNRTLSFRPPPVAVPANWRAIEQAWPDLRNIRARLSDGKPFVGDLCAVSGSRSITLDPQSPGILPRATLEELCLGSSSGLFSLVSQISPAGSANFEDLAGLDLDADAALLAIVTQSGDDIIVYRRFFHGN